MPRRGPAAGDAGRRGAMRRIGWGSLALAGSGFVPTLRRTVPNARRLGSARDTPEVQSALARRVCRDHMLSFARMSTVLVVQLVAG